MRTLTKNQAAALNRAAVELIPAISLQLMRDRFAQIAFAQMLRISDRTCYLPETTILDSFTRANNTDLGASWAPYGGGFGSLQLVNNRIRAAAISGTTERLEVYDSLLPADQWAAATVRTWTPGAAYVQASLILRGVEAPDTTPDFYLVGLFQDVGHPTARAYMARYLAGSGLTILNGELTGERIALVAGDRLLAVAHGQMLRLYVNDFLLAEKATTAILSDGRVGAGIWVDGAVGDVELDDFAAGPYREEYLGLLLTAIKLGQQLGPTVPSSGPASCDLLLTQLMAVLGRERFSDLIRHGLNQTGAYDPQLTEVLIEAVTTRPGRRRLFPLTVFDDFTRADAATLGLGWRPSPGAPDFSDLSIVSGEVRSTTSAFESNYQLRDEILPADQWAELTITRWQGTDYREADVVLRGSDPLTGYGFGAHSDGAGNGGIMIYRTLGGATQEFFYDQPISGGGDWQLGDRLRGRIRGGRLEVYRNDRLEGVGRSHVVTGSGRAGLIIWVSGPTTDVGVDNFRCGAIEERASAPQADPDRLTLGRLRVAEVTEASEHSVTLACQSRDAFLDALVEGGRLGTPFFPLNIGNWQTYTGFGGGFMIEIRCDGTINPLYWPADGMEDNEDWLGPFTDFLLIDFERCSVGAGGGVTRFYEKTSAVYRDLDLLPGTTLRINWTNAFSEIFDAGVGWSTGPNFTAQVVVFEQPESQAELQGYKSGLHPDDQPPPTVKRVLATETFSHGEVKGTRNYPIEATEQFFGIIMSNPPEPGGDEDDTAYSELHFEYSFP